MGYVRPKRAKRPANRPKWPSHSFRRRVWATCFFEILDPGAFDEHFFNGLLGRTHAVPMRFEAAVRAFLTPIELTVEDDAVYYRDARFCSKALTESGVLQKAHDNGRFKLPGFGLDVCCRHVWVDLGDRLIEVDAQVLIYDEESQLYLSVVELDQIKEIRRSLLNQHEEHRLAVDADIEARFEHLTGQKFDQWVVKPGRSKRGKKASIADRQETMPYFQHTSKQRP